MHAHDPDFDDRRDPRAQDGAHGGEHPQPVPTLEEVQARLREARRAAIPGGVLQALEFLGARASRRRTA